MGPAFVATRVIARHCSDAGARPRGPDAPASSAALAQRRSACCVPTWKAPCPNLVCPAGESADFGAWLQALPGNARAFALPGGQDVCAAAQCKCCCIEVSRRASTDRHADAARTRRVLKARMGLPVRQPGFRPGRQAAFTDSLRAPPLCAAATAPAAAQPGTPCCSGPVRTAEPVAGAPATATSVQHCRISLTS